MTDTTDTTDTTDRTDRPVERVDGPMALKVRIHPGLCEGWGNCHRWAPDVYPLDEDGKIALHVVLVPPELAENARPGAAVCPAGVITVVGEVPVALTGGTT